MGKMGSKGVKVFSYIGSGIDNIELELTVPNGSVIRRTPEFAIDQLAIEKKHLSTFDFVGRFNLTVRRDGRELTHQWQDINCLTGKLTDGTLANMENTPAVFAEDLIIIYCLYDAGPGIAGLPSSHQVFVTITKNNENWMREVIPQDSEQSNKPFSKLVLSSAHDIGMNSMDIANALLKNAGTEIIKEVLGRELPSFFDILNKVGDGAINRIAPDIIRALAITQKESADTILKTGARYIAFRPAKCHRQMQRVSPLEDTWYFQHGAIPGMQYRQCLEGVVQFLLDHGDEIVVWENRWDGVPGDCPRPSDDELRDILNDVLRDKALQTADEGEMMSKSVRDLRNEKKRLIMLQNASQTGNYDDAANATLDGDKMVDKLNDMANNPPSGHSILSLQVQATATNIKEVIVASVLDSDVSTSPLLATKPILDHKILPVLHSDTGKSLMRDEGLVIITNDFFDGATADIAIQICRERLE